MQITSTLPNCGIVLRQAANGHFLTREELSGSYAIIRHNVRTYRSDGVVEVVKGKQNAESALKKLQGSQTSTDHHEGWRYFLEETELKPGMDPAQATRQRWTEFEARESKAMGEPSPEFPRR